MARSFRVLNPILILSLLLPFFNSGGILNPANAQAPGQGSWCIARPSTSDEELQRNIHYICNEQGIDCSLINDGGPCCNPNTYINHASVAMNIYYQNFGRNYWNCDFGRTGVIVVTDPSYDNCKFEFRQ
ncbi:major pollen allergen Ole e 10-like [Nicotiana tomentosiformis]|uniref:major pollen allergen Ole e 10-like n=1 Tax=Nicotiana tomentosiformis TaxID=4098 RepID=UPI00051ACA59|nr:major pollen allergen Ole e 10-like [Nicotiana tomentosiformis]